VVPFGVTYEKIGTIQRRLAWPLHKDDTLSRSGRPTGLNIYFMPACQIRQTPARISPWSRTKLSQFRTRATKLILVKLLQ
ncbi:hypothetical protein POSPLADRAFT_1136250, partial [Postia placenta MAD-698-R-SB12]